MRSRLFCKLSRAIRFVTSAARSRAAGTDPNWASRSRAPFSPIPGAPGIGEKGARDLLAQFGSVPAALDRAAEVTKRMARESLQNNRERIEMSLRLATIHCDVPIPFEPEALLVQEPETETLKALYKELEFFSHLKEMGPS